MKRSHFLTDPDPAETRRQVLVVLAEAGELASMTRREIQGRIFGLKWGAGWTASACLENRKRRLIEEVNGSRRYRITDAGRAALELARALADEAAS